MKNVPPGLGNRAKRYRKPSDNLIGAGIKKRKSKRVKRKNGRKRNKPKIKKD
jgi:hypothetical protein